jgi:outer membrane biosynthesis protein TonB
MTVPIGQFYPVLIVLWAILLWTRSRVFRTTLLISLCLHVVFLVRIGAREAKEVERERVISFTFVQGAEETERPPTPEGINRLPENLQKPEASPPKETEETPEEPPHEEKMPEPPRVVEGLPKIEDASLLDPNANPAAESYRLELQRVIRVFQKAPADILEQGVEARVRVWFNLSREGTLNQPIFLDSTVRSSNETVNRAAVDSVVAASEHFPPFPENVIRPEIWFHVDVDFGLSRFPGD